MAVVASKKPYSIRSASDHTVGVVQLNRTLRGRRITHLGRLPIEALGLFFFDRKLLFKRKWMQTSYEDVSAPRNHQGVAELVSSLVVRRFQKWDREFEFTLLQEAGTAKTRYLRMGSASSVSVATPPPVRFLVNVARPSQEPESI